MKISKKTEYAMRTVLDLGLRVKKESPARVADIARRQHIPPKFLEQILLTLKTAGIVESRRGLKGGFLLAKQPSEITLASILSATEGSLKNKSDVPEDLPHWQKNSPFNEVWKDIDDYTINKLEKITLHDMCKRAFELFNNNTIEYVI
ncbi:RrF2 family transcriptional regulator [Verrucomicrobiota bacterium]